MTIAAIADKGPVSIRVFTIPADTDDSPCLIATIRLADNGDVDALLRAHGWARTTPWARRDDMPDNHTVAALVALRSTDPDIVTLERDQAAGRERRGENAPNAMANRSRR